MTAIATLSPWRAWRYLVFWSFRRQVRARLLLVTTLGLLALIAALVLLTTHFDRWNMLHWRTRRTAPTFEQQLAVVQAASALPGNYTLLSTATGAWWTHMKPGSGLWIFSNWVVLGLFTSFLLPLLTLTFATEGLGRPREDRTLVWLLMRPLSRPALFLGQFLAVLPWCLLTSAGSFVLLCLLGGTPGRAALPLYWPAVLLGTLAFTALFHLFAAWFRRAAILALAYSFLLETIAGILPGQFKRLSVSFYIRCMMLDEGRPFGITPVRPATFQPISGSTATWMLIAATVASLALGMWIFTRKEYMDTTA
jgi:ABC-type transport system involved in multi-copper enzyme maturation permease subunit